MTEPRTQFAMAAVDLAGLFNTTFSTKSFQGYRPKLTEPEGQSTGGGVQSLEHITLLSESDGNAMVVGSVNSLERKVSLRAYPQVAQQFEKRYPGRAFDFQPNQFQDLQNGFQEFFQTQAFEVSIEAARAPAAPTAPAAASSSKAGLIIGAVSVILLALAAAYFLFLKK